MYFFSYQLSNFQTLPQFNKLLCLKFLSLVFILQYCKADCSIMNILGRIFPFGFVWETAEGKYYLL